MIESIEFFLWILRWYLCVWIDTNIVRWVSLVFHIKTRTFFMYNSFQLFVYVAQENSIIYIYYKDDINLLEHTHIYC